MTHAFIILPLYRYKAFIYLYIYIYIYIYTENRNSLHANKYKVYQFFTRAMIRIWKTRVVNGVIFIRLCIVVIVTHSRKQTHSEGQCR